MKQDIVLMSTADWNHPFWTNKQHTAQTLVKLGYRVFYIDSLGSRKLRLGKGRDIKRIWRRIQKIFSKPVQVQPNLWVWSPCVLPLSQFKLLQWSNRLVFSTLLTYWTRKLSFSVKPLFWTYNPLSLLYITPKKYAGLIYHCVDNIAEQPGAFASLIYSQEKELVQSAQWVFVTSRALEEQLKQYRPDVYYFPNVVDFEHFYQASQEIAVPMDLQNIPTPRAGFIGAISAYKVNLGLLAEAAKRLPAVSFVLIGEVGEGDPDTNVAVLQQLKNVYFLGPRAYGQLPNYLKGLDVCLIPAHVNDYTKAMFPMKFFEYLAAGKPIVATDIPAIKEYADVYFLAKGLDDFAVQIEQAINNNSEAACQERQALAKKNTYLSRTQKMLECMQ